MRTTDTDASLVPFAQRVRGLQVTRLVLVLAALAGMALDATLGVPRDAFPADDGRLDARILAMMSVAFLVLTTPTLLAPRWLRSKAIAASSLALLGDGVFLAVVTYGPLGFGSPLSALVLLHAVAVTLLSSFRTGLKVAVWHTLLMTSTFQLQEAGVIAGSSGIQLGDLWLLIGALWLLTLSTASFAAVNEREIRRRNYDLVALTRLSLRLEASLRPTDVGTALLDAVHDEQGATRAVLLVASDGRLERLVGVGDTLVADDASDPAAGVMVRRAVEEHRTLRVATFDQDRDAWLHQALPGARNTFLLPVYAEGGVVAVLVAEHGSGLGTRVEARVVGALERYASHAGLALANARLLVQMRGLAETDGLTGVANRRSFDRVLGDEVARLVPERRPVSLVLVDIDHFKALNDTHGHQAGDAVLREVAQALAAACRPSDTVARFGGEEFAVVLPGISVTGAQGTAERLRLAVSALQPLDGAVRVTASFGVAHADDPVAAASLVARADVALYDAKRTGRDRVVLHPGSGQGASVGAQASAAR